MIDQFRKTETFQRNPEAVRAMEKETSLKMKFVYKLKVIGIQEMSKSAFAILLTSSQLTVSPYMS